MKNAGRLRILLMVGSSLLLTSCNKEEIPWKDLATWIEQFVKWHTWWYLPTITPEAVWQLISPFTSILIVFCVWGMLSGALFYVRTARLKGSMSTAFINLLTVGMIILYFQVSSLLMAMLVEQSGLTLMGVFTAMNWFSLQTLIGLVLMPGSIVTIQTAVLITIVLPILSMLWQLINFGICLGYMTISAFASSLKGPVYVVSSIFSWLIFYLLYSGIIINSFQEYFPTDIEYAPLVLIINAGYVLATFLFMIMFWWIVPIAVTRAFREPEYEPAGNIQEKTTETPSQETINNPSSTAGTVVEAKMYNAARMYQQQSQSTSEVNHSIPHDPPVATNKATKSTSAPAAVNGKANNGNNTAPTTSKTPTQANQTKSSQATAPHSLPPV